MIPRGLHECAKGSLGGGFLSPVEVGKERMTFPPTFVLRCGPRLYTLKRALIPNWWLEAIFLTGHTIASAMTLERDMQFLFCAQDMTQNT